MNGSEIVAAIERELNAQGISKGEFYTACNVSSAMMSNWRKGKNLPLMNTMARINDFLGTDLVMTTGKLTLPETRNQTQSTSGLRLKPYPQVEKKQGLIIGGNKKTASPSADGVIDKLIALDPEMRELFVRILAAAKEDPERVKRYLAFLVQELEGC